MTNCSAIQFIELISNHSMNWDSIPLKAQAQVLILKHDFSYTAYLAEISYRVPTMYEIQVFIQYYGNTCLSSASTIC